MLILVSLNIKISLNLDYHELFKRVLAELVISILCHPWSISEKPCYRLCKAVQNIYYSCYYVTRLVRCLVGSIIRICK